MLDNAVWSFKTVDQSEQKETIYSKTALLDKRKFNQLVNDLNELMNFVSQRMMINTIEETTVCTYKLDILEMNEEINQDYLTDAKKYLEEILKLLSDSLLTFLIKNFEEEKNIVMIVNSFESLKLDNVSLENGNINFSKRVEESKTEITDLNKKLQAFKKNERLLRN